MNYMWWKFDYTEIFTESRKGFVDASEVFSDHSSRDLYIGLGGTESQRVHAYFLINGKRYDGAGGVFTSMLKTTQRLSSGIVVRIKDVPEDIVHRADTIMTKSNGHFSFTCSRDVCSVLNRSGLKIGGYVKSSPSRMLYNLLSKGISTEDGTRLKADVFYINPTTDLRSTIEEMQLTEVFFLVLAGAFGLVSFL